MILACVLSLLASGIALQQGATDEPREPGLILRVWWIDEWMGDLPKLVPGQTPNVNRVVETIDFREPRDFEHESLVVARLDGWLEVAQAGAYGLRLSADDAARLFLDGHAVLDNDRRGAPDSVETELELDAGPRRLRVEYFNDWGHAYLKLEWRPPGAEDFSPVPAERLSCASGEVHVTSPGKKEIVRALPRGRPGDRMPLDGVHPAFDLATVRPEGFEPKVGGMGWLSSGELVLSTWDPDGSVWLLDGVQTADPGEVTVQRFAAGLAEPLGLAVVDDEIFVLQKQELTQLVDHDGDRVADEYRCIASGWKVTANFHEFAFGLLYHEGAFHANLAVAILPGGSSDTLQVEDRGKAIRIRRDGTWDTVATGLRTPNGIGIGSGGHVYLTDNQGDWLPVSKLLRLEEGAFYGSRAVLGEAAAELEVTPPVAWLPQGEIGNSPSQPGLLIEGPYAGQTVLGDVTHGGLKRVFVEEIEGVPQGTVFRFTQGLEAGINRLTRGPDGALYVGGIGSTGNWGQEGKARFGLQRLACNGASAFEMLAVRSFANGLEVELTEPLEPDLGDDPDVWQVEDWRYEPTADYGGPKLDRRELRVRSTTVSADRRRVFLELEGLGAGRVVWLRMLGDLRGATSGAPWATEAWTTLNRLPDRTHPVDPAPARPPNTLTDAERGAGWRLLFDGESTAGWRNFRSEDVVGWEARDGCLVRTGPGGDLVTDARFDDFELELEWAIEAGGNSGVFFHVTEDADHVWQTGPEMQILDTAGHLDGKDPKTSAGANYALHAPPFDATRPLGRFNRARIVVRGPHVEHWLNGHLQCHYELWSEDWRARVAASKFASLPDYGMRRCGHVALQDHGDPVRFRNLRIRPLDTDR